MKRTITLTVNGVERQLDVQDQWLLSDTLREQLKLYGVREGCGTAVCGSCTVLLDGKPLTTVAQGSVSLHADAAKGNQTMHVPIGVINATGAYEIVTVGKKGAPPGWYKVVIYSVDDPQPMKPNKYFVHKDYADVEATPLRIEVIESPEAERYDLKLKK